MRKKHKMITANRLIITLCLLSFLNYSGCYSVQNFTRDDLEHDQVSDISLLTKEGSIYFFSHGNYRVDKDSLYGIGKKIKNDISSTDFAGKIAFNDIDIINCEKLDAGDTILLLLGLGAAVLTVYLIVYLGNFQI